MPEPTLSRPRTPSRLPQPVWILSWVSFFADISSEMAYPLLPLFLIDVLGSSKTQLGTMEGGAVLIVALMSAFAGFRSDRAVGGGRVPWIRLGYGLPVIGKAVIAVATVWPLVLGGRLLDRLGKGLRGAPRDALIADSVRADQRGQAFGLHRAFDTAGAFAGVLLSAILLWWLTGSPQEADSAQALSSSPATPAWIYRAIFGLSAGLGLLSLVLTFLVRESGAAPVIARHGSSEETPECIATESHPAIGQLWFNLPGSYWSVLAILTLFSLANSSDTFILLRASDLGYSPWAVVLVYAIYNITYAALSYPVGILSDKHGRWRIMGIGWTIYAVVYAGFALLPDSQPWGMWPLMAVYGIYMALTDGIGKALIADHTPQKTRGAAMGLFYAVTGLTTFGASLLAGIVWDHSGPQAAFMVGAPFATLSLLALLLSKRHVTVRSLTS